jgi:hydrogenase nickel incorporation protein HypB
MIHEHSGVHAHDHSHGHERGHDHEHLHSHGHDHDHGHGHSHTHAAPAHHDGNDHGRTSQASRGDRTVRIERDLLERNNAVAKANRERATANRISIFNLIGGPGAGKTSLLEATIPRLDRRWGVSVLEGDQSTDNDARRIKEAGCTAFQINTGTGCHLDASMVANGLSELRPREGSIVFVENVGNLVCPALFDLGERAKIVVMSVTEGEDKPLKYPHIFRAAELFVLTKLDLQPLVALDEERCIGFARQVNPKIRTLRVSSRTGQGMDDFVAWIGETASRATVLSETAP